MFARNLLRTTTRSLKSSNQIRTRLFHPTPAIMVRISTTRPEVVETCLKGGHLGLLFWSEQAETTWLICFCLRSKKEIPSHPPLSSSPHRVRRSTYLKSSPPAKASLSEFLLLSPQVALVSPPNTTPPTSPLYSSPCGTY